MAWCKNVGGGPGDDEKTITKKCNRGDTEAKRAAAVAATIEVAEVAVFALATSYHQLRGLQSRSLRLGMVVHVVLSCLEVSVSL